MWVDMLCWIDHVCLLKKVGVVPSVHLDIPSIGFNSLCGMLSPHLGV